MATKTKVPDFYTEPAPRKEEKQQEKAGCCGFLGGKRSSKAYFSQTLVVLRHSERQDYVDKGYKTSEEGLKWPHDAPLTKRGHQLAEEVANELAVLHKKAGFIALATSPFRRCVETAAAVAKVLKLPVIVDQELGEVWDKNMPKEPSPFRQGKELRALVESLGIKDGNPTEAGGLKLFGKPPQRWPETLEDARTRFLVRIETYIEESAKAQKNYILVTHADAVAGALKMFEHGNADVQHLDFCARCIASRSVALDDLDNDDLIYAQKWDVDSKAVSQEILTAEGGMAKYYERQHLENVEEKKEAAANRKKIRTKTDAVFSDSLKKMAAELTEEDEAELKAEAEAEQPSKSAQKSDSKGATKGPGRRQI